MKTACLVLLLLSILLPLLVLGDTFGPPDAKEARPSKRRSANSVDRDFCSLIDGCTVGVGHPDTCAAPNIPGSTPGDEFEDGYKSPPFGGCNTAATWDGTMHPFSDPHPGLIAPGGQCISSKMAVYCSNFMAPFPWYNNVWTYLSDECVAAILNINPAACPDIAEFEEFVANIGYSMENTFAPDIGSPEGCRLPHGSACEREFNFCRLNGPDPDTCKLKGPYNKANTSLVNPGFCYPCHPMFANFGEQYVDPRCGTPQVPTDCCNYGVLGWACSGDNGYVPLVQELPIE